jgi:hypothetical protein
MGNPIKQREINAIRDRGRILFTRIREPVGAVPPEATAAPLAKDLIQDPAGGRPSTHKPLGYLPFICKLEFFIGSGG